MKEVLKDIEYKANIRILFLCESRYYYRKMSRVRFHGIEAISKSQNVDLRMTGPGFEGWDARVDALDNVRTIYPNWEPAMVIGYKPLDIKGYSKLPWKKVIRYNEMWDVKWTMKEIITSKSDMVICHHYNDYLHFKKLYYDG